MAMKDDAGYRLSATPAIVMAQLLGIAAIALMLVWMLHFRGGISLTSDNKQLLFNVHPVLMLLGIIYFGGQAIMVYKTVPGTKKVKKFVHMVFHLLALLLGGLGLYAVFKFHRDLGIPHVYSLHSWLGMATICLFALQWLFGFFAYWLPGTTMTTRANFLPWHSIFGTIIFLMAICSAEIGLAERFFFSKLQRQKEAFVVNFTGVAILFFGIFVLLTVILPRAYYCL